MSFNPLPPIAFLVFGLLAGILLSAALFLNLISLWNLIFIQGLLLTGYFVLLALNRCKADTAPADFARLFVFGIIAGCCVFSYQAAAAIENGRDDDQQTSSAKSDRPTNAVSVYSAVIESEPICDLQGCRMLAVIERDARHDNQMTVAVKVRGIRGNQGSKNARRTVDEELKTDCRGADLVKHLTSQPPEHLAKTSHWAAKYCSLRQMKVEIEGELTAMPSERVRRSYLRTGAVYDLKVDLRRGGSIRMSEDQEPLYIARLLLQDLLLADLDKDLRALPAGIVFGNTSLFTARESHDMRETGTSHILAVSGQNVVLVAAFLYFFLRMCRVSLRTALPIGTALIVAYAVITCAEPPVVRASLMFGAVGIVAYFKRVIDIGMALWSALALLLLLEARSLFNIGFELSFLATFTLIYVVPLLTGSARDIRSLIYQAIVASGVVGLIAAPLTAYYFGAFSAVSILANLVIVPLSGAILFLGMFALLMELITGMLAGLGFEGLNALSNIIQVLIDQPTNIALEQISRLTLRFSELFSGPLLGYVTFEKGNLALTSGFVLMLVALVLSRRYFSHYSHRLILIQVVLLFALPVFAQSGYQALRSATHLWILDVGQGDSTLIKTSDGKTILIDGGPDGARTLAELEWLNVKKIDAMILTHPHADHLDGLLRVASVYRPSKIYMCEDDFMHGINREQVDGLTSITESVIGIKKEAILRTQGSQFMLRCFAPPIGSRKKDQTSMLTVRYTFGSYTHVTLGDIDPASLSQLGEQMGKSEIDSMLVPHHGSRYNLSEQFYKEHAIAAAVISAGRFNFYGHPHPETIKMLSKQGIATFRTDEGGTQHLISNGATLRLRR